MRTFVPVVFAALALGILACHSDREKPAETSAPTTSALSTEGASDDPEDPNDVIPAPASVSTSGGSLSANLLAEAERQLSAMHESSYSHATHIDEAHGVFDYDCSGFVDYSIARVAPPAFATLQSATKRRPLAGHIEAFFASLSKAEGAWHRIDRADALLPGDIIAWKEPIENHSKNTGHVMIVARAPSPAAKAGELAVTIIDSSHSGHGPTDARTSAKRGGLGKGPIVLLVDASSHAVGYRWSDIPSSKMLHTDIAFGRLE